MITSFPDKIIEYAQKNKDFLFVQVGANDGVRADPIYDIVKKYHWKGILIEPMLEYFNQLKENYKGENQLIFENVAISNAKSIDIYCIKKASPWLVRYFGKTLSSSSKSILEKNMWFLPGFKKYLTKRKVFSITLRALLKKHQLMKFDLLIIDTEGYDYEVLKQISDLNSKPVFVYYEHKHLSEADKSASWEMLQKNGYKIETGPWNTFGTKVK